MGFTSSVKVLTAGAVWRLTGAAAAGSTLIEAVGSEDENDQTLAGMMLVQAGDRSVEAVTEALASGATSAALVDVLTGIGSEAARKGLESIRGAGGSLGEAATEALTTLDAIDGLNDPS